MPDRILTFPPFTLDLDAACLRRGRTRRPLTPKDFALLHYLVTHPGQVVSHAELLRAVWADTVVSPEVLKVRVGRLRRLLGDKVAAPTLGHAQTGAVIHGACQAAQEQLGIRAPASYVEMAGFDPIPMIAAELGDVAFADAVERGRRLSLEEAIDLIEEVSASVRHPT